MMTLFAMLIAAAGAGAEKAPQKEVEGEPIALTTEAQVKELCALLRDPGDEFEGDPAAVAVARRARAAQRQKAIGRSYRVQAPSKGFALGRYDEDQSELELDGNRPLRAADDSLTLDLEGLDDVAFRASPEQVARWTASKKAGKLAMVVVFQPSGERCAGSAAADFFRLSGIASSWRLVEDGAVVAAADEEGLPVEVQTGDKARTLRIRRVTLDDDPEPPSDEGKARLSSAQGALDRCAASSRRGGAMVVMFAVESGRVRDPQVILDAVRDESFSTCVARALSGAPLAGAGSTSARGTASLALQ